MRKETGGRVVVCVICKRPITEAQRPSVQLQSGEEAHLECYAERERQASKPN